MQNVHYLDLMHYGQVPPSFGLPSYREGIGTLHLWEWEIKLTKNVAESINV